MTRTTAVASNTAVVIGGSLSGLLAARVLAERFDEVILVERDSFPDEPSFRKGVPQSRHLHVLLARGAQILDGLLPGFLEDLEAEGGIRLRWPGDFALLAAGGWIRRDVRGLTLHSSRRELLEHVVRRRVIGIQNVRRMERHQAVHLLAEPHGSVHGVRVRSRLDGTEFDIDADLVVDAGGRETRAPAWLEDLGFGVTPETIINSSLGYASRVFAAAPLEGDWRAIFAFPKPPDGHRGGALFPIDHEQWLVTVGGNGGDYPPIDEPGFMAFVKSLRTPLIYEAIRDAVPVSGISAYRRTENRLRHYDALRSWPDGFIVTGDAACCFNPVYGQGMTVAGQDALVLRRWLLDEAPTQEFQRRLAKSLVTPWVLATSEDFRYPTTIGGPPSPVTRVMHKYLDRVNDAAVSDRVVAHAFTRVLHMVGRPQELFHPEVVVRTLSSSRHTQTDPMAPPRRPTATPVSLPQELGLREGRVEVEGGVELHYVEAGEGPPVVLLHGFPEFWYSWRNQLPALASAGYRAIAVDMRGFGRSDKPGEVQAYRLQTVARDVERVIKALPGQRASVVGHDFGGLVAYHVAMRHPDAVERLVIINAPHPERGRVSLRSLRQLRRSWYIGLFQIPALAEAYVRWGDHQFIRRALRAGSIGNGPEDIERYVDAFAIPGAARSGLNYYRALARSLMGGAPATRRIDAPVMVIWGEQDPYLDSEWAEPVSRWVPDVRMERLPDAGHWPQIDRPDRVNSLLLDFLERRPGVRQGRAAEILPA